MKIFSLLVICFVAFVTHADEFGLVGEIDLNNDGVIDRIQSGPSDLFGQAGGPLVVTLSENGNSPAKSYVIEGNGTFAIERTGTGEPIRLWSYWRMSCCQGVLSSFVFTHDGMEQQHIKINPGDSGTAIGRAVYNGIFDQENLFALKHVSPYSPPPNPSGLEWGK